jgi:segregation and condensation protein A
MTEDTQTRIGSQQEEMPFALVHGEPLATPPEDLFIPPDALEVILEAFEGPLDLLLYLIKRQNLDILDIPVAEITAQYMGYIAMMETMRFELAAEYLLMAAMLAEIKSRMLLPRPVSEEDEDDPRAELVRRLQEYERFKQAAEDIDELARLERDFQLVKVEPPVIEKKQPEPDVELKELLFAFADVLKRADMFTSHAISREPLSMRERMSKVLDHLQHRDMVEFNHLFSFEEGRRGVVVTFIAVLELMKAHLVDIAQAEPFAPIYIKPATQASES